MKKFSLMILLTLVFAGACNTGSRNEAGRDSASVEADDLQGTRQCYLAVDGADTAFLNLAVTRGQITGNMVMRMEGKPENNGTLKGQFSGDTLFADYTFTTGEGEEVFRNPMAFLKDGEKLILGVGTIETYLGRSYLSKKEPISFDKGRFRFEPAACE